MKYECNHDSRRKKRIITVLHNGKITKFLDCKECEKDLESMQSYKIIERGK